VSAATNGGEQRSFDADDPDLTRFDLVREGARRDGVEIVHYEPKFPVPGTKAERRIERTVAALFTIAGLASIAFVVIYIAWPWEYERGSNASKLYTPLLGFTLALACVGIGFGIITWVKKLMPDEVAVEKRHLGGSATDEKKLTAASLIHAGDESGITRRPLLKGALALGIAPIGIAIAAPIIGGLIKDPHSPNSPLFHTGFDPRNNGGHKVRLVREDNTPVRPEDVSVGGQITVFPGIPGGTTNAWADSPTLLIHLRVPDANETRDNLARKPVNGDAMYGNFVAYSKICTHLGCPASLYEQQTNRLLCPCHQSQFMITDNAKPIFGPATRALPMLPIELDDEGFFVAKSDYRVAIGPAFWERP
jgi:ubiquinol-cytochrome c reductase iron-sulfur subunit